MKKYDLKNNHKVGVYLRISRKDKYRHEENESIENQRDDIEYFLEERPEFIKVREYIDDGKTGQNYNRADFVQLEKDLRKGIIDTIITKDLSRLGRDHIKTGQYVQVDWIKQGIRYIAVEDEIDTAVPRDQEKLIDLLASNDKWSATTSKKVRRAKEIRAKKGSYQGFVAPYGYKKVKSSEIDEDNIKRTKTILVEDEKVSQNVKDIFYWYVIENIGTAEIARRLNSKNIIAPCKYMDIGCYRNEKHDGTWSVQSIITILKNEVYIGNMVSMKTRKLSYKTKDVRKTEKEEQIKVCNTHIPIIEKEIFEMAQEKMKNNYKPRLRKHDHELKGLVFCQECNGLMTIRSRRMKLLDETEKYYISYGCSVHNGRTHYCSNNACISATKLYNKVIEELKKECSKVIFEKEDLEEVYKAIKKETSKEIEKIQVQIENKNNENKKLETQLDTLYNDKIEGIITTERYIRLSKEKEIIIEKNKLDIDKLNEKLEGEKNNNELSENSINKLVKISKQFLKLERPSKEMLDKLIDKIYFSKNREIKIKYKFKLIQYKSESKK